jgi:hypothetical protein
MPSYLIPTTAPELSTASRTDALTLEFKPWTNPSSDLANYDLSTGVTFTPPNGGRFISNWWGVVKVPVVAGNTYTFSLYSSFDPASLLVYNNAGKALATNAEADDDRIFFSNQHNTFVFNDTVWHWKADFSGDVYVRAEASLAADLMYLNVFADTPPVIDPKDKTPPKVAISVSKTSLGVNSGIAVTFEFSEPVQWFSLDNVLIFGGGGLSNLSGSGTKYQATFTTALGSTPTVSFKLPSGSFSDSAGNTNTDGDDANNQVKLAVDTQKMTDITSIGATISTSPPVTVLVKPGVLGADALLLEDVREFSQFNDNVLTKHTLIYQGISYNYADVDDLVTIVRRGNDFSAEFTQEIADSAPNVAGIRYARAVELVGLVNMKDIILQVAGADGNFVG